MVLQYVILHVPEEVVVGLQGQAFDGLNAAPDDQLLLIGTRIIGSTKRIWRCSDVISIRLIELSYEFTDS